MSVAARLDRDLVAVPTADMPVDPAVLRASGLSKQFGGVTVLSDVTLNILPGEIHTIISENGAGKSTFMRLLSGYIESSEGTLSIDGHDVRFAKPDQAQAPVRGHVKLDAALITQANAKDYYFPDSPFSHRHRSPWRGAVRASPSQSKRKSHASQENPDADR